ncbi:hypothetical protein Pcinc_004923 [Petrolisthes cinctipes]|uniref:Uncharacterized protein n=1 Tax=Petrolisthes cinctipes TaxID=88211 RepID=A0AAE1L382_PETCI|nr:hypothetical protein Pcinc_004923 [Petrolisthes cinctipes]
MRNLSALWASHKAAAHDGEKTGVDSRTGSHNRTLREWNVHSSHSQDYGVLYGEGFTVDQDRIITAAAEANPHTNAVAIRDTLHLDASVWTVTRRLHEAVCCQCLFPRRVGVAKLYPLPPMVQRGSD